MRTRALTASLVGAWLIGCGAQDPASVDDPTTATTTQASSADDGFIDRDHSGDKLQNASKLAAELGKLSDEAAKIGKIISTVSGYGQVAVTALEMLGVLQSAADVENARFEALHQHLNQLGVALSSQALNIARDQRLSDMRTFVNIVDLYASRGGGRIDESLLSPSEVVELGNARSGSQQAAQNATELSAFQWYYSEHVTDSDGSSADWKRFISKRPDLTNGLAFDWRLGVAELMQLVNTRLALIGTLDPSFRNSGERMTELSQYRSALEGYYKKMTDGIVCYGDKWKPVTVVCADIYTGLASSTQFNEPSCFDRYNAARCQARINPELDRMKRSLMTRMPLFQMRSTIDALSAAMTTSPDFTTNRRIRLRNTQNCVTQVEDVYDYVTDPYSPTLIHDQRTTRVTSCASDVNQQWSYDRPSGQITNAWGGCLGQPSFLLGGTLMVKPCSNSAGEHWTYDPVNGVLENAFHGVLSAPSSSYSPPPTGTEVRGASTNEAWESPPPVCGLANEYESLTLSCPSGQRIIDVPFASYGTPSGQCGSFQETASCHAAGSVDAVSKACIGKETCTIAVGNALAGDPCAGVIKKLAVQVRCAEQPAPPTQCGTLAPGQGLFRGQELKSCDGRFIWRLGNDGSLQLVQRSPYMSGYMEQTIYGPYASSSSGSRVVMQNDGNLVFYDMGGNAIWASWTQGSYNSTFAVQNDGNLVIYGENGGVRWTSNTCCR